MPGGSKTLWHREAASISNQVQSCRQGVPEKNITYSLNFVVSKGTWSYTHFSLQMWCWCLFTPLCFALRLSKLFHLDFILTPPFPHILHLPFPLCGETPYSSSSVQSPWLQCVNKSDFVGLQVRPRWFKMTSHCSCSYTLFGFWWQQNLQEHWE